MIKITDDVFDIARRIKGINNSYELYYDNKVGKFKVYAHDKLELVLPFDSLDKRSVDFVEKTQIKNLYKLTDEIEKHNEKLVRNNENKLSEEKNYKIKELEKYIKYSKGDFTHYDNI